MARVRFEPSGKIYEGQEGSSILDIAEQLGLHLDSVCGGKGKCGRCKVILKKGRQKLTDSELENLTEIEVSRGVRLACQLIASGEMVVEIPPAYERGNQIILTDSAAIMPIDPPLKCIKVEVFPPTLEHQVADFERFCQATGRELKASLAIIAKLSDLLKKSSTIYAVIRGHEVVGVTDREEGAYGLAVDVGTTTVVAYLVDLTTGIDLSVYSSMNPQIAHGDDVISRITYSMEKENGRRELQREIVKLVSSLLQQCCAEAGVCPENVYEVVIVGNTAMHHMFFGLDTHGLALSPYVPVVASTLEIKARQLKIPTSEEAYVYSLPNIAGFVGADHVAVLLSTRLWEREKPTLVIDIGTNGEISLGSTDGILSASCAAGPAFEGGCLSSGIRGIPGAIDHLTIGEDLEPEFTTIGAKKPRGICGSGAIDAVWEMFRSGVIDSSGRIREELEVPRIRVRCGQSEYVIAFESETATGEPVVMTQEDIVQIQYAKAALYAGITLLMDEADVKKNEIDSVLLAGAFGNYIDTRSARNLGIIPEIPLERIMSIGNAAGTGAKIALLSQRAREEAVAVARKVRYLELAAHPEFEERFYEAMYIPHFDSSLFPEAMADAVRSS